MTTFWESTDWAATGSCLQAIAGFASAAAIVYAVRKGLNTFAQWRRQRQADRQIAVAERVLTLVYRAKDAFRAIRSPAVFSGELSQAEEALEQTIPGTEDPSRRLVVQAQVVVARIAQHKDLWNELFDCLPLARAFLGVEVEQLVRRVWQERSNVDAAAHGYAESEGDREFRRKCEATIWEYVGAMRPEGDAVTKSVDEIVQDAERILLPVLRSV